MPAPTHKKRERTMPMIDAAIPYMAGVSEKFDMGEFAAKVCGMAPKAPPVKPRESFNDDDIYIYDAATLEIFSVIGSGSPLTMGCKYNGMKVPAGHTWERGLSCKNKGLWTRRQDAAERMA